MAEVTQYTYSHKDLVTLMVRDQDIHEGLWSLLINFGFGAANVGQSAETLAPAAVVQIGSIGLQRATDVNSISVDAAVVNPAVP